MGVITQTVANGMAKLSGNIANSAIGQAGGIIQATHKANFGNNPGIQDETNANLGTNLVQNEKPLWQQQQELLWQREDEKQKHVEEREDTAASRYIEDLRRSGVNPNLYNGGQAASGGGITNATQADYSMDIAEFNKTYELLMQEIELNFKGEQAKKDRIAGLVKSLIQGGAILGGVALKSSK